MPPYASSRPCTQAFDGSTWTSAPNLLKNRANPGLAVWGTPPKIYAIGSSLQADARSVTSFDGTSWTEEAASMNDKRDKPGVAVFGEPEKIYAVGGRDHTHPATNLKTVEVFDGASWQYVESMATHRCCHGVAVLGSYLYAVGGIGGASGSDGNGLNSVEKFDGTSWSSAPSMNHVRSDFGLATFSGKIYAVAGGRAGVWPFYQKTVESFDGSSWTVLSADLPTSNTYGKMQFGIAVMGSYLYVVGGYPCSECGGAGYYAEAHKFDGTTWSTTTSLPGEGAAFQGLMAYSLYDPRLDAIGSSLSSASF